MFRPVCKAFSIDAHQRTAMRAALIMREMMDAKTRDDGFLAGMLHGVGRLLVAARRPDELTQIVAIAGECGTSSAAVEAARWGVSCAEVGAYLLGIWGLAPAVVAAIARHHRPSQLRREAFGMAAGLYVASRLAVDPDIGADAGAAIDHADHISLELLGELGVQNKLEQWRDIARRVHELA